MMRQRTQGIWSLAAGMLILGIVLAFAAPAAAWSRFHSHTFLGFSFYGYPYYGYPYYGYPYSVYPYSYNVYSPEEHRRFPTFQLPGFFHYLGALGKGEEGDQVFRPPAAGEDTNKASGQETPGSPGR